MRYTTTILMFFCAVLLIAGIFVVERYVPSTKEAAALKANPLPFTPEEVDAIELDVEEVRTVLGLRGGVWQVSEPFEDRADPDLVARLLKEVHDIEWVDTIKKAQMKSTSWDKTGLESARVRVRLKSKGGTLAEAWFGNPSPMEGSVCISTALRGGATTHHVAKTTVTALLKNPAETWRDSKLLRFANNKVTRLSISDGAGRIEVARTLESPSWMLMKPLKTRGHDEHIDELLSTLLNLKVDAAAGAKNKPPASSPLVAAGAPGAAGNLEIEIELIGGAQPLKAVLKKPAEGQTTTEATVSDRNDSFTVSSESLHTLWARPNDLRDDKLARLKADSVTDIRIESLVHPDVVLQKQQDSWFLQRHGQMEPANGERAATLLSALTTHRIRDFASDSASNLEAYGLQRPALSVTWTAQDKQTRRLSFGSDPQGQVFAKYDAEPFVYQIAAAVLAAFPTDAVKWKGLNPLRFSMFALRRVSLALGTAPPVVLDYNPENSQWTGTLAGKDITAMIDRAKADRLAGGLSKIQVQDWVLDRTAAVAALANPAITLTIDLGTPGEPSAPLKQRILRFSPTNPGTETAIYYGQLDGGPDVFYVTRESLRVMLASVLTKPE